MKATHSREAMAAHIKQTMPSLLGALRGDGEQPTREPFRCRDVRDMCRLDQREREWYGEKQETL